MGLTLRKLVRALAFSLLLATAAASLAQLQVSFWVPFIQANPQQSGLSLSVATSQLNYCPGEAVIITGTLLNNGDPVPSAAVIIQVTKPSHATIFADMPATNGVGQYSTAFTLPQSADEGAYTVYAAYASSSAQTIFWVGAITTTTTTTTSSTTTTTRTSTGRPSWLDIAASPTVIDEEKGETSIVQVRIIPPMQGKIVRLEISTDLSNWRILAVGCTGADGLATMGWSPSSEPHGTYYLRAAWDGDSNYQGAESQVLAITVVPEFSNPIALTLLFSILLTMFVYKNCARKPPSSGGR